MIRPAEVMDGDDMNQDLHHLLGYVWSTANTNPEFDSAHMSELIEFFLNKHRAETI